MAWELSPFIPEKYLHEFDQNQISSYGAQFFTSEKFFGINQDDIGLALVDSTLSEDQILKIKLIEQQNAFYHTLGFHPKTS